jgi:hypothetical protein
MKRRIIAISLLAPLALAMFAYPRLSSDARIFQERRVRKSPAARRVTPAPAGKAAPDYSRFSHRSRSHQQACASCHEAPTSNWRTARGFPDIADYPGHESCVSCHRQQFFNGARPAICTICHTNASPRDDLRFAFGQPNAAHQAARAQDLRQFKIEFPHDKHQDVIATLLHAPLLREEATFAPASFNLKSGTADEKRAQFNNCTICHETNRRQPLPPKGGWPGAFVPAPETFKTVPASHASCFSCHWKSQPPTKDDCAGCHTPAATAFIPQSWPTRISAKFIHEGGGPNKDHIAECTTCHINITKASTLRGMTPDVPIAACSTCHNNDMQSNTYKQITTIEMELDGFEKTQNCSYCHTPDVGRKSAPRSHCRSVGWPFTKCGDTK